MCGTPFYFLTSQLIKFSFRSFKVRKRKAYRKRTISTSLRSQKLTIVGRSWPLHILSLMRALQFPSNQFERQNLFIDIDIWPVDVHMHLWIAFLHQESVTDQGLGIPPGIVPVPTVPILVTVSRPLISAIFLLVISTHIVRQLDPKVSRVVQ